MTKLVVLSDPTSSRWPGNYGSSPTLVPGGETDVAWTWSPEAAPEPIRRWVESSDPVLRLARRLLQRDSVHHEALLSIDAEVRDEMRLAVEAALRSPEPDPDTTPELVLAQAVVR